MDGRGGDELLRPLREIDGDTSRHVLKLEDYGGSDDVAWVLLEEASQ